MQAQLFAALSRSYSFSRAGIFAVALILTALAPAAVSAGEPVAVIEKVEAPSTGLQFMDFVEVGRLIKLRAGESLTLGYFGSCIQESIVGGSVQVGMEQSSIEGGEVSREQVECDGGRLQLDANSNDSSGVLILRKIDAGSAGSGDTGTLPEAQLVLAHTQPIIGISKPGSLLRIDRLDASEPRLEIRIEERYLDLATTDSKLTAGGLYRAEAVGHAIVFRIDAGASPGGGPVVGRLLYL